MVSLIAKAEVTLKNKCELNETLSVVCNNICTYYYYSFWRDDLGGRIDETGTVLQRPHR